jgi:two-component system nitrate/nitrite response regulator NarL
MTENPAVNEKKRVVVIDDHPLIRRALAQLLAPQDDLVLAGEASTCDAGCALVRELQPDLVLLDLNFGRTATSGLQALRALRDAGSEARILVLTVSDDPADLAAAIRAGADGYLLKDADPEELLKGVRDALHGRTVIGTRLAGALADLFRRDNGAAERRDGGLTERETHILYLLTQGQSNKLIAQELDIAEGTVKVHVKRLLNKLRFRSRLEAAVWAIEQGIKPKPDAARGKSH